MGRLTENWLKLANAHPFGLALVAAIGLLFIIAIVAAISVFKSKYRIPITPDAALTVERLVPNLRDEAYKLSLKLQKRVTGYTVLNFVLVMIELLGSLFFAVTGLHGQFTVAGGEAGRIAVPAELATFVGIAILLAGSLKAGFQPNTRKVEYAHREWLLSNIINDAEASIADYNSHVPANAALLVPVSKALNEAIKDATKPVK